MRASTAQPTATKSVTGEVERPSTSPRAAVPRARGSEGPRSESSRPLLGSHVLAARGLQALQALAADLEAQRRPGRTLEQFGTGFNGYRALQGGVHLGTA